ncbi:hotdog domain-containing protein [Sulfurimonas sp.]|uniref:acyl-CoA thioesterase n=1 Tax=Sulfurimonas sp. TaxID=2022749 RepID=UPI0025D9A1B7|nr:hotdog domain-containing protein [Sulfurimonas sp.]
MKMIALRGRVFPTDLNHAGTVFGGWIMGKMDKAASIAVEDIIFSPAVTVAVSDMKFIKPIHNGAIFTIYTEIIHIGRTSIKVDVDVQIKSRETREEFSATKAVFTFVVVDAKSKPKDVREVIRYNVDDYVKEML